MPRIQFDKSELCNLQYSLRREILSTNRAGGYMSTTIVGCNIRKYHGLFVSSFENEDYVLLSSLDETIIQNGSEFNLALHRYKDSYEPRGHKYIVDFNYTPTPTTTYQIGDITLQKELLWIHSSNQLLIKYSVLNAHSQTILRLRPLFAFRSRHALSKANDNADINSYSITNGIRVKPYQNLPSLYLQSSKPTEFIPNPCWHYNFEYLEEKKRGYDYLEDLFTTGYFEFTLKQGETIILSASPCSENSSYFDTSFFDEISRRSIKTEFIPALKHSARQFIIGYQGNTMLTAGYHWYNPRSRETFISLAGCTLTQGLITDFEKILDHHVGRLNNGLFGQHLAADTQLWFFKTLQSLNQFYDKPSIWNKYNVTIKEILNAYRNGSFPCNCIRMENNGLIWASLSDSPLTWMRAMIDSTPVTRRAGFTVEVNALWYNAVCYAIDLAKASNDTQFLDEWSEIPEKIKSSFINTFWIDSKEYLADYLYEGYLNQDVRPNQLLAISLDYSPLSFAQKGSVLECVRTHLLTNKGIRSLSPRAISYKGRYSGNELQREESIHQGTAHPWLLEYYIRAGFEIHGNNFMSQAEDLLSCFQEDMLLYGIGSISELYDGDPPHHPAGAISYAPSVGALLTISQLIETHKDKEQ